MSTLTKTNEHIDEILGHYLAGESMSQQGQVDALRAHSRDLATRIDSMMLRVANTPIPEGDEALTLFGDLATDLRKIARGES